jgi:hypothetical protein
MKTVIVVIAAAATLAPAAAAARQHDPGVHVRTAVRVEQQTPPQRRLQERDRAREAQNRRDDREEQSEKISRTLKVAEIDLSNLSGDITITRGGNSVQVDALKVARGRTVDEAKAMLGFVTIEINERGPRAEVKAVYRGHEERARERRNINVSVQYTVTAPEGTKISARSLSGSIRVTGIKGELNLVSLSGDIVVTDAERVLSAKSTSGNVQITNLRAETGLEANSVSGAVIVRDSKAPRMRLGTISGNVSVTGVDAARIDAETISGDIDFMTRLQPNGRYELSSHAGTIRIVPTGNTGFEIAANSFSGNIRSEITLEGERQGGADTSRRGPGGRTRSLRGVFGDGSAMLDVTTFSGTVVLGKK